MRSANAPVSAGGMPVRAKNVTGLQAVDQRERRLVIEWHWREHRIAYYLDHDTSEAKHEQRAPNFIAADTNNYLASGWNHGLHQDALNLRGRCELFGILQHALVGGSHVLRAHI